jgi:hypothetical protein
MATMIKTEICGFQPHDGTHAPHWDVEGPDGYRTVYPK